MENEEQLYEHAMDYVQQTVNARINFYKLMRIDFGVTNEEIEEVLAKAEQDYETFHGGE